MVEKFKTLEVVTLQLPSKKRYQENLDKLLKHLDTHKTKHLVLAPEVFLTAFDYEHMNTVAKFSAKALKILKKEVNEQIVVLTMIFEDGDDFVNQAIVIHKHKIIYKHNKTKLFKLGDEDLHFRAGKKKKIQVFELDGLRYAILICFELRFKELWEQIEGADVVLIPARWGKTRQKHLEILSRALAVMNQCYVLVSNASDIDMARASAIISPHGEVIMDEEKESLEGQINLREIKKIRRYISMA